MAAIELTFENNNHLNIANVTSQSIIYIPLDFYPAQSLDWLGQCVACESVSVWVTIFLHILLLTLNYHSPPLYAGIFILLKLLKSKHWRRDQLGPV